MQREEFQTVSQLLDDVTKQAEIIQLTDYSLVKISGENAENFLQGQITCDVTKITQGKSGLGALCNHQGRVLALFTLFKKSKDYFCLLPRGVCEQFISHLMKYAVFSKVSLEDVTGTNSIYACVGKEASSFLTEIFNTIPNQDYGTLYEDDIAFCNLPGAIPRFIFWGSKSFADEIITKDPLPWKLANILSGYATIYGSTMAVVTPHMLNLHLLDAVSFNKGCYVGQEIIARTHYLGKSKRHLCRGQIHGDISLLPGELIYANGQETGVVMDVVVTNNISLLLGVIQDPIEREFSVREEKLQDLCKFF